MIFLRQNQSTENNLPEKPGPDTKQSAFIPGQHNYAVMINSIDRVKKFVSVCQKSSSDVTIYNKFSRERIPGDSILGLFSINLNEPVKIHVEGSENDAMLTIQALEAQDIPVYIDKELDGRTDRIVRNT